VGDDDAPVWSGEEEEEEEKRGKKQE